MVNNRPTDQHVIPNPNPLQEIQRISIQLSWLTSKKEKKVEKMSILMA